MTGIAGGDTSELPLIGADSPVHAFCMHGITPIARPESGAQASLVLLG